MENGNKYEANRKEINIKEEKMKDIKLQKMLYIAGFFVISAIGTLLHFAYNFCGENIFIAPFSAVNESVWDSSYANVYLDIYRVYNTKI